MEHLDIYNKLYDSKAYNTNRDTNHVHKWPFIENFLSESGNKQTIIDIGSGRGWNTHKFLEMGKNVIAIEPCNVIKEYQEHVNLKTYQLSIGDFINKKMDFMNDAVIVCTGVVEHLEIELIDFYLRELSYLTNDAFYGVANHDDTQRGIQLHPIQEDVTYWSNLLKQYYETVTLVPTMYKEIYFQFNCYNSLRKNEV